MIHRRPRLTFSRSLVVAPVLVCAACAACAMTACSSHSSSTTPTTTADAASDAPARTPKNHRASVASCPTDRPAGHVEGPGVGTCTKDADCTKGKNGRCYGGLQPPACTYDECAIDADCGNAVCECRVNSRLGQPNVCFKGNCRTDGDCASAAGGGNYCSPSAVNIGLECMGVKPGSFGYFCHGRSDECIDDDDCGGSGKQCVFDVDVVHWKCVQPACPG